MKPSEPDTFNHPQGPTSYLDRCWDSRLKGVDQTLALGRVVAGYAQPGDQIALIGELGAGKTQFVRGLAQGLGIDAGVVSSPTFVLVQQYTHPSGQPVLQHVDAYRLEALDDSDSIGWGSDVFDDAIVAVEWADRLAGQLSDDRLEIHLFHDDHESRRVSIIPYGGWLARMPALCRSLEEAIDNAAEKENPHA